MRPYPLLSDRDGYRPGLWNLPSDPEAVAYWKAVFRAQLDDLTTRLTTLRGATVGRAAGEASRRFFAALAPLEVADWAAAPTVHHWTVLREQILRDLAIDDPYREVKTAENERALALFAATRKAGRQAPNLRARLDHAIAGIHSGNLFDLGSPATARAHAAGADRFAALTAEVLARPLAIDGRAALAEHLESLDRGARVVILVDNAGPDFICGVVPFALILAEHGMQIVLAANETPSLNDVTCIDAAALLEQVARLDPALPALLADRVCLVSTGTGQPGIDLGAVSDQLAAVAGSADLLVLEGQGRAIETNWNARIEQAVFRVSTVKDPMVASYLGVELYALIADFRVAGADPPLAYETRPESRAARYRGSSASDRGSGEVRRGRPGVSTRYVDRARAAR